jgi:hypothetical protein
LRRRIGGEGLIARPAAGRERAEDRSDHDGKTAGHPHGILRATQEDDMSKHQEAENLLTRGGCAGDPAGGMAAHRARSGHPTQIALVPAADLDTALRLRETSQEADMPVVDGQDLRVIGEVRCLDPGLAGLRALCAAERGGS